MSFHRSDDGPLAILTLDHGELNLFDGIVIDSLDNETRKLTAQSPAGASDPRGGTRRLGRR
jgi:hypothetical protein